MVWCMTALKFSLLFVVKIHYISIVFTEFVTIQYFVLNAIFFYCMYFTSSILSLIFKARVMCLNPSLILVFVCAKLLIIMEIGQFLHRLSNKVNSIFYKKIKKYLTNICTKLAPETGGNFVQILASTKLFMYFFL